VSSNFDLAPPAVTTAGITVVPVDIQTIDAHLTFDAGASTASGDATLTFEVGGTGGRPSFDLRQPITGVWLDGAPVPVSDVLTLGLGGGAGANVRVLDRDLASGSMHALRLTYDLGLPTSSLAGGGPGPRLAPTPTGCPSNDLPVRRSPPPRHRMA
jgi:hypothetical protein